MLALSHGILGDLQASTAAINLSKDRRIFALQSPKKPFNILELLLVYPFGKKGGARKRIKKSNANLSFPFSTQNPPGVHETFLFPLTL